MIVLSLVLLIFFAYQVQALAYQAGHSVRPGSLVVHVGVVNADPAAEDIVHGLRVVPLAEDDRIFVECKLFHRLLPLAQ